MSKSTAHTKIDSTWFPVHAGYTERKPTLQKLLFGEAASRHVAPFKLQLLKWIGNKQRFAHEIASYFPNAIGTYFEPFLGGGAVLGTLKPSKAVASDVFPTLIEIWQELHDAPENLKRWYADRWASGVPFAQWPFSISKAFVPYDMTQVANYANMPHLFQQDIPTLSYCMPTESQLAVQA